MSNGGGARDTLCLEHRYVFFFTINVLFYAGNVFLGPNRPLVCFFYGQYFLFNIEARLSLQMARDMRHVMSLVCFFIFLLNMLTKIKLVYEKGLKMHCHVSRAHIII